MSRVKIYLSLCLRIISGGILALAGISKILEPVENFQGQLAQYEWLPMVLIKPLAHVLPWLEWIIGLSLVIGWQMRKAAVGASLLYSSFLAVLLISVALGISLENCGCFGSFGFHPKPWQMILIDSSSLLMALYIWRKGSDCLTLDQLLGKTNV